MPAAEFLSYLLSLVTRQPDLLVLLHRLMIPHAPPLDLVRIKAELQRLAQSDPPPTDLMACLIDAFLPRHGDSESTVVLMPDLTDDVLPYWNGQERVLLYGDVELLRFGRVAPHQIQILDAFEQARWTDSIDNPLPVRCYNEHYQQMRSAIKALNSHLRHPLIRFSANGKRGVRWEPCDTSSPVKQRRQA